MTALLLPPPSVAPADARIYRIRVVGILATALVHGVMLVAFFALGHSGLGLWNVGALAANLGSLWLCRRGAQGWGAALSMAEASTTVPALSVVLGPSSGHVFYFFGLAATGFLVFRPHERVARRVCLIYIALGFVFLLVASQLWAPWVVLPPGQLAILAGFNALNTLIVIVTMGSYTTDVTARAEAQLEEERQRSERLLLNMLPAAIAERLKRDGSAIAEGYEAVTVLFADIVGFTRLSERIPPAELVELLNRVFSAFDALAERFGLEKIKTIGDAYMVVGGLPHPRADHADAVAEMALEMLQVVRDLKAAAPLELRIGIHTGPVVAGVIGTRKYSYDLWGDTVNTASRMESHSQPGAVQVSAAAFEALRARFHFEERGEVEIKGKGPMSTFWLKGRHADAEKRARPA